MKHFKLLLITLIGLLVIAACTSTEPTVENTDSAETETMAEDDTMMDDDSMASEDTMMDDSHDDSAMDDDSMAEDDTMMDDESMASEDTMMDDSHDDSAMDDDAMMDAESMADRPAWQQIELTNAVTGERFTFADFSDKTVFVEPMATWCTNCRRQLDNVKAAQAQAGDDVVFIGLSVETSISDTDLASYAAEQGYESFVWAVATPELLRELAGIFGQTVANPPSTPHFIVAPDGTFGELITGIEPADLLIEQINEARG